MGEGTGYERVPERSQRRAKNAAAMRPKIPVLSATRGKAPDELVEELDEAVADAEEDASSVELLTRLLQLTLDGTVTLLNSVRSAHCKPQSYEYEIKSLATWARCKRADLEKRCVTTVVLHLDRHVRAIRETGDIELLDVNRNAGVALDACREERHRGGERLTR